MLQTLFALLPSCLSSFSDFKTKRCRVWRHCLSSLSFFIYYYSKVPHLFFKSIEWLTSWFQNYDSYFGPWVISIKSCIRILSLSSEDVQHFFLGFALFKFHEEFNWLIINIHLLYIPILFRINECLSDLIFIAKYLL